MLHLPKIVYKFRDWENQDHKNIIINNEVFMASPRSFNDPFDCKIFENYSLLDTEEKKKSFINQILSFKKERLEKTGLSEEESTVILNKMLKDPSKLNKEQEIFESNQVDNCYGVFSLGGRWDSLLMWSHYANNHEGFSIGFDLEKMMESGLFGMGMPVVYDKNYPIRDPSLEINPIGDTISQLTYKSLDWKYEEEFRLINLNPDGLTDKNRIIKIPDSFFQEIYLGLNISKENRNGLIEVAKDKGLDIYQIEKVPFKFEVKRVKI